MSRARDKDSLKFIFFIEYEIDGDEVASWIDQSYSIKNEEPPEFYEPSELFTWALDFVTAETKTENDLDRVFILTDEGIKNAAYPGDKDE